jgi:tetratricopeptide repeat protein 21B
MERANEYRQAAEYYRQAWILGSESDLSLGYKVAVCLFRDRQYIESIDTCHRVLRVDANYPRIRREILEKAWMSLRA